MRRFGNVFRTLALAVVLVASFVPQANATTIKDLQDAIIALQETVSSQAAQISALQQANASQAADLYAIKNSNVMTIDPYLTVDLNDLNGLKGPHVIFTGANVHIRSGSGSTDDGGELTGLGNLVIGYNEQPNCDFDRSGSHNFILGTQINYSSYAGLVAGYQNSVSGPYASVSGGVGNTASGLFSSVSGGAFNQASGVGSSISGGGYNHAEGGSGGVDSPVDCGGSVSGGYTNTAGGFYSSVSGGRYNNASGGNGFPSSECGGSVSGGYTNTASGANSSVSGGSYHTAPNENNWVGGIYFSGY